MAAMTGAGDGQNAFYFTAVSLRDLHDETPASGRLVLVNPVARKLILLFAAAKEEDV